MKQTITLLALALCLVGAAPSDAQGRRYGGYDNAIRFYGGTFELDGESDYWSNKFFDFTGDISDFDDWSGSIDYMRDLRGNLRLLVGGTIFEGSGIQAYRDFVDAADRPIRHETTLDVASATVGLAFTLAPRQAPIIPYVGAGAGLYAWNLEESGEFVDFAADPLEIFPATFEDDGVAPGWFWLVGLEVPITSDIALFAQGRWHRAEDELEGDFDGLGDIDLSGQELSLGLSWRF